MTEYIDLASLISGLCMQKTLFGNWVRDREEKEKEKEKGKEQGKRKEQK